MARNYPSSFCGKIDELPFLRVDNFEDPEEEGIRAFFLSHCHTDHTVGLYTPRLCSLLKNKKNIFIYMTELSAAIVETECKLQRVEPIMEYIRPLAYRHELITLPGDGRYSQTDSINVTLIPAGHCTGSTMFLFQDGRRNVLYTGDFRLTPNTVAGTKAFHNDNGEPISLDALYVDTTFFEERYHTFPRRSGESMDIVLSSIQQQLSKPNGRVALYTPAKYGYEYVYNEIYKKLGVKVYVDERKWSFYRKIQHLVPGVTNDIDRTALKIHVCWKRQNVVNIKHDKSCLPHQTNSDSDNEETNKTQNQKFDYLHIHFSAMIWEKFEEDEQTFTIPCDKFMKVCFATHCSRSELLFFVNYFPPKTKKVVGFPNEFKNEETPVKKLVTPPVTPNNKKKKTTTPTKNVVPEKKVCKDLFEKMFKD